MPTQRARELALDFALGLEIELNGLGPPAGPGAAREQLRRELRDDGVTHLRFGHAGRRGRENGQQRIAHGVVHACVHRGALSRMVHVLDPYAIGLRTGFLLGHLILRRSRVLQDLLASVVTGEIWEEEAWTVVCSRCDWLLRRQITK